MDLSDTISNALMSGYSYRHPHVYTPDGTSKSVFRLTSLKYALASYALHKHRVTAC